MASWIIRFRANRVKCTNAEFPDLYGHYREAKFTQTKHHWWWKANRIFEQLALTKHHTGTGRGIFPVPTGLLNDLFDGLLRPEGIIKSWSDGAACFGFEDLYPGREVSKYIICLPKIWSRLNDAVITHANILRDKKNCTVRFGKCFFWAPLTYPFCCLVPCYQWKLGKLTKNSLQNLLYSSFCLLVPFSPFLPSARRSTVAKSQVQGQFMKNMKRARIT